ncbi:hypothetical protein [Helicobacter cinaedi]|uniref:hypothetical protein n=2 Tax=Helicobacter cinaedi TaxID=213 RepID=UPI001057C3BD|nr:hypothetical protein [Helicobacter cinaedi]QOQ97090.1 hypothetical protein HW245_05580 [Helicobacter cinaedi]
MADKKGSKTNQGEARQNVGEIEKAMVKTQSKCEAIQKTPKRGKANVGQVQKHKTKVEKMCGAGQSRNAKTPTQSNANRAN